MWYHGDEVKAMYTNMEPITRYLPEGWEQKARELKAFTRRGDYIETPEDLLRILMIWGDMGSYGMTESFLRVTRDYPLSKVAIYERVKKSAAWLQWLVVNYCRENFAITESPEYLSAYQVYLVDATKVSKQGSSKADYVLHSMISLFSLAFAEQHLTSASTGESMRNFESLKEKDLVVADRAYGTPTSIRWVEDHRASYVFRLKANSFKLYEMLDTGEYVPFCLADQLSEWKQGKLLDFNLYYKQEDIYRPIRICAKGKTKEAIARGYTRTKQSNHGAKRVQITPLQEIYNRYIVVVTNLPSSIPAEAILELYRMRWQIELVFKRLKSILAYDELLTRKDSTSQAWFWCKLLTAAICETYIHIGAFSPSAEKATDDQRAEVVMAGIRGRIFRTDCFAPHELSC